MTKLKAYKNPTTLKNAARSTTQLNASEVINKRYHNKLTGWSKLNLSDTEQEKFIRKLVDAIGGRKKTYLIRLFTYSRPNHWALRRFFISPSDGRITYCAGQDYIAELNELRRYLYAQ